MIHHCLAFPASGRPGGALAGEYASDSRIRHSPGSAVAFLKRLADSGNNQRYHCGDVEGNKGLVGKSIILFNVRIGLFEYILFFMQFVS